MARGPTPRDPTSRDPKPRDAAVAESNDPLPDVDVWLLDGFNVLHAVLLGGRPRGQFWERDARTELIARLARGGHGAGADPEVVVVFDGPRAVEGDEARPAPGIEVVFAPSADDWIVQRVRRSEAPERIGVVTQDRRVAGRVRHAGARVVAPRRFLAAHPGAAPPLPSDGPSGSSGSSGSSGPGESGT